MEHFVANYMAWAAKSQSMGRNTRRLFKGIKTARGFWKRHGRFFSAEEEREKVKPNGSLMRCSPFAVLEVGELRDLARLDCSLTNPNATSRHANLLYLEVLHLILRGTPPEVAADDVICDYSIFEHGRAQEVEDVVRHAWETDEHRPEVGVKATKGFVLNSLWCAFRGLRIYCRRVGEGHPAPVGSTLKHIVALPGNTDTDTNAAIAGALLGAAAGYARLSSEPGAERRITTIREAASGEADREGRPPARFGLEALTETLVVELRELSAR